MSRVLDHLRRQPIAYLALFFALTGTGLAAGPALIDGGDIRDGSIRSVDIRNGALKRQDFRRGQAPRGKRGAPGQTGDGGLPGPPGPAGGPERLSLVEARVAADGSIRAGSAQLTHPEAGVYCLTVAGARWAHAVSADAAHVVAATVYRDYRVPDEPCPISATVRVSVVTAAGQAVDGPFSIVARPG